MGTRYFITLYDKIEYKKTKAKHRQYNKLQKQLFKGIGFIKDDKMNKPIENEDKGYQNDIINWLCFAKKA